MQIGVKMGYAHHDRVNVIYSLAGSRYTVGTQQNGEATQ